MTPWFRRIGSFKGMLWHVNTLSMKTLSSFAVANQNFQTLWRLLNSQSIGPRPGMKLMAGRWLTTLNLSPELISKVYVDALPKHLQNSALFYGDIIAKTTASGRYDIPS